MRKEFYVVDRFEGKSIVLEGDNEEIIVIAKEKVEAIVCEGDVLTKVGEIFYIDKVETKNRKDRISKLMKGIWVD